MRLFTKSRTATRFVFLSAIGILLSVWIAPAAAQLITPPSSREGAVAPGAIRACSETSEAVSNQRLQAAAQIGDVEAVRSLISCGADLNALTLWRETFSSNYLTVLNATPLHAAAWNGHLDVVDTLVNSGAAVDLLNEWGFSILLTAAEAGHADVVSRLLAAGADVNQVANCEECVDETALTVAADRGHINVVKVLLAAGADTTHQDREGDTAFDLAARNNHVQIVELLSAVED